MDESDGQIAQRRQESREQSKCAFSKVYVAHRWEYLKAGSPLSQAWAN